MADADIFGLLFATRFRSKARIGQVLIDAVVKEEHIADAKATSNPIEAGREVCDHVIVEPERLTIEGVISDTPVAFYPGFGSLARYGIHELVEASPFISDVVAAVGDSPLPGMVEAGLEIAGYSEALGLSRRSHLGYRALRALLRSRTPLKVVTGLRVYKDMVMTRLAVSRDVNTGDALRFISELRHVRIVEAKTIPLKDAAKKASDMAKGSKVNLGTQASPPFPDNISVDTLATLMVTL